jgi:transglutaminase-like putative cysteine protease
MMRQLLRRVPFQTSLQVVLLLVALNALVLGLGRIVHGAQGSAFLPAALLAALLGWGLGQSRLKPGPALGGLTLLGGLWLWGQTARLGSFALQLGVFVPLSSWLGYLFIHGGPPPTLFPEIFSAWQGLTDQSVFLGARLGGWLMGLLSGTAADDPVSLVLLWSWLCWLLAGWAAWSVARNRVFSGLLPALAVLAWVTEYTGAGLVPLWLLSASLLGLVGLVRFETTLRRWGATGLDYAEYILPQTFTALILLVVTLAALGWALPQFSLHDFLEKFRRQTAAESQTARSLGLEPVRLQPTRAPSPFQPLRGANLPNLHLLGSGPELSQDVVFTVKTGELPPVPVSSLENSAPRHYWRSYTYDVYTGAGWVSSPAPTRAYPANQALYDSLPPGYRPLTQNFHIRHGDAGLLYWTGNLYRSDQPFEAAWRLPPGETYPLAVDPFRGADLLGALNQAPVYQVESLVRQVEVEALRAAGRNYPDFIQTRYTQLPAQVPERVYALARSLTATAATPYDEAQALESYLRATYPYSLEISAPPPGMDVADYFLFELKTGFCDYYATALVVMARSLGLPARLVTGFASGTYQAQTAEYLVTAADAHAWVEIYFPGQGWVEFEPTAGQPEIARLEANPQTASPALTPAWQWNQLVRSIYGLPPLARWLFTALAVGLGFLLAFLGLESWLLPRLAPARALGWIYRRLYRQGARLVGAPGPGQTAAEFTQALQTALGLPDPRLDLLTSLYLRVLFSPEPLTRREVASAVRAWRGLRWKLFWVKKGKS